jgi:hypothetical protein
MTTNSSSTIKLTDAQLVALSAASRRPDRCIAPPEHLKGGAIAKFASSLLSKGFAEEIEAAAAMPIVRRNGEQACALVITVAGFAAIGIEAPDSADPTPPVPSDPSAAAKGDGNGRLVNDGAVAGDSLIATDAATGQSAGTSSSAARYSTPREGTKLAHMIAMLEQPEGVVIGELMATTGWLAHTTRAALTGLRKRGYAVELKKGLDGNESRYRITATPIVAKAA